MATTVVTMQQLLEAGAHFGHQTHRWNPKMEPYIFGDRNEVHVIDLSQTVPLFARALDFVQQTVSRGGKVLFVGTKRQAQDPIAAAAQASRAVTLNQSLARQGMLTNWKTISNSIKRLKVADDVAGQVGGHDDVELGRVLGHLVGDVVDDEVLGGDLRVLRRELLEDALEHPLGVLEDVGLGGAGDLGAALALGQLERIADDLLGARG